MPLAIAIGCLLTVLRVCVLHSDDGGDGGGNPLFDGSDSDD